MTNSRWRVIRAYRVWSCVFTRQRRQSWMGSPLDRTSDWLAGAWPATSLRVPVATLPSDSLLRFTGSSRCPCAEAAPATRSLPRSRCVGLHLLPSRNQMAAGSILQTANFQCHRVLKDRSASPAPLSPSNAGGASGGVAFKPALVTSCLWCLLVRQLFVSKSV